MLEFPPMGWSSMTEKGEEVAALFSALEPLRQTASLARKLAPVMQA